MQKIVINKLGPLKHISLNMNDFMIFTGTQASGKSTLAKSIFFFKNIKNILWDQIRKSQFYVGEDCLDLTIKNRLIRELRSNFLQTFGSTWCMERDMSMEYYYKEDIFIKLSLKDDEHSSNYIWIQLSPKLIEFLEEKEKQRRDKNIFLDLELSEWKDEINHLFNDYDEIIYIPAGRSLITLLSSQLNYIYSFMDDTQKRNLDYCTQNYLETILKLKPNFVVSLEEMIRNTLNLTTVKINRDILFLLTKLMKKILHGEYRAVNGEERLQVETDRYVKINFASSGQQEAVWILNVLFYYLLNNKKAYFIIEEPESHLFPNAQKLITEAISLAQYNGSRILITTHSPYILGTINNLLYANKISKIVNPEAVSKIINQYTWIEFSKLSAYFIENGVLNSCVDTECEEINNEVIDGASEDINNDYEDMVTLKLAEREMK